MFDMLTQVTLIFKHLFQLTTICVNCKEKKTTTFQKLLNKLFSKLLFGACYKTIIPFVDVLETMTT